ncbi:MAG: FcoT family thioesterase, partial [Alphaproteobacteria bacterium]
MSIKVSEEIINKALKTYIAKNTRYIIDAQIDKTDNSINLTANFSIKESCYLSPASGHFNAVEALMCFNQMLYVAL